MILVDASIGFELVPEHDSKPINSHSAQNIVLRTFVSDLLTKSRNFSVVTEWDMENAISSSF